MGQNGEVNSKFGAYRSLCCRAEIVINAGSAFPDCPNHPKPTTIRKPVLDETIIPLTGPQSDPPLEGHIENRRLIDVAFGRLKLAEWEQNHCMDVRFARAFSMFLSTNRSVPYLKNLRNQATPHSANSLLGDLTPVIVRSPNGGTRNCTCQTER